MRTDYYINPLSEAVPQVSGGTGTAGDADLRHTWTEYCGNFVYENDTLRQTIIEGGYISYAYPQTSNPANQATDISQLTPTYHFYVRDHLGNNRLVMNENGTIEQVNHYYPFGGLMGESRNITSAQRYKYNGKELDRMHGLDWYDYGARHYDASIGRWMCVDPLAEKYYPISPYAYCLDNPIKLLDKTGKAPGDFFKSVYAAANDFGQFYNANSIVEGKEYGSSIFEIVNSKGEKGYSYTIANIGNQAGVNVSDAPLTYKTVATIHTHGRYTGNDKVRYRDNEFSGLREGNNFISRESRKEVKGSSDIGFANRTKLDSYLVTPNGSLQNYNPMSGKITVLNNNMPSDPKDPNRMNTKTATFLQIKTLSSVEKQKIYSKILYHQY